MPGAPNCAGLSCAVTGNAPICGATANSMAGLWPSVTEPLEDTPTGRLTESMLAAIAQFDNDVRAERTVSGMKSAVLAGRSVWQAPVGYRRGPPGGSSLEPPLPQHAKGSPRFSPSTLRAVREVRSPSHSSLEPRQRRQIRQLLVSQHTLPGARQQAKAGSALLGPALAKLRLRDAELDDLDVEAVLAFAERLLTNMSRSWNHMNPEQKRRFQSLLFPKGITFDGERFGTAETSTLFRMLEPATDVTGSLASPGGFEPPLPA